MDDLSDTVGKMGQKVDALAAKGTNGSAGRMDKLVKVSGADGSLPTCDYPENLMSLLVAGNESLPDNTRNNWNAKKSKKLLLFYEDPNLSARVLAAPDNPLQARAHCKQGSTGLATGLEGGWEIELEPPTWRRRMRRWTPWYQLLLFSISLPFDAPRPFLCIVLKLLAHHAESVLVRSSSVG